MTGFPFSRFGARIQGEKNFNGADLTPRYRMHDETLPFVTASSDSLFGALHCLTCLWVFVMEESVVVSIIKEERTEFGEYPPRTLFVCLGAMLGTFPPVELPFLRFRCDVDHYTVFWVSLGVFGGLHESLLWFALGPFSPTTTAPLCVSIFVPMCI